MGELGTPNGLANGSDAEQRGRQMRLAGGLFIFGSLFGLPSTLILTDVGAGTMLPFTALGVVSGILCLLAPWERISPAWAHVVLVAAVAEVAAVAVVTDSSFLIYYVIIGVFISYAFADRRVIGAYLALITLVLVGHGIGYAGDDPAATQLTLLTIPTVLISAVMVAFLREQLEASRLKYQRFAEEALELAARLRGQAEAAKTRTPAGAQAGLPAALPSPALAGPDLRRVGLGIAGVVLAIPLGLASLAAAGVTLPDAANDVFERVGISLPNQSDGTAAEGEASTDADGKPGTGRERSRDRGSGQAENGAGQSGGSGGSTRSQGGTAQGAATGPAAPAQTRAPSPPANGNVPAGGAADSPPAGPLDNALHDTLDLLDRVVPMQAPQPEPPPEQSPAP